MAWEEVWASWCGGGGTPFGPSHLPHPYTDQKDNQKSSRIPPKDRLRCKINANEAGPSLGRPGPEVALVGVALAADGNGDGSGSRSKNKFRRLMCAGHGARYFTRSNQLTPSLSTTPSANPLIPFVEFE